MRGSIGSGGRAVLDRRWRLWLSEQPRHSIEHAAARAHPRETGGVLLGVYVKGRRPWVTAAVEVISPVATGTYYELAAGAAPQVTERAAREDARLGYLGLWHTHPADVGASALDLRSMREVAAAPESGGRPVLLIARRRGGGYALDVHQFDRRRPRPLRVIAAGPLEAAGTSKPGSSDTDQR